MTSISEIARLSAERYPDVGVCIYYGATDHLEDEHIVPFGLWVAT